MSLFSNINFTSFIPSGLNLSGSPATAATEKAAEVERLEDNDTDGEDNVRKMVNGKEGKKKKEKTANETYVIVRPPPAKSNHPLNLQVQLVPPTSKPGARPGSAAGSVIGSPRPSGDGEREGASTEGESTEGAPLSRTSSSRSAYSQHSAPVPPHTASASTTSFASYTSVASSTSSRRVIIPILNLQAHNVMTNTIVDAGTDSKIARFTKKGLEMVDVGMLECTEVWASRDIQSILPTAPAPAPAPATPAPVTESQTTNPPETSLSPPEHAEPASSSTSLSSSDARPSNTTPVPEKPTISTPPTPTPPRFSKRQAFRNFFTKPSDSTTPTATPMDKSAQTTPKASDAQQRLTPGTRSHNRVSSASLNFAFRRDRSASPNPSLNTGQTTSVSSRGVSPRVSIEDPLATPQNSTFLTQQTANHSALVPPALVVPSDNGPQSVGFVTSTDRLLLPATLGIQPTLNSLLPFPIPFALVNNERGSDRAKVDLPPDLPYKVPRGPAMYVWVVRRWLKQSFVEAPANVLGFNLKGFTTLSSNNPNGQQAGKGIEELEVRFEWTKKAKGKKKGKKGKRGMTVDSEQGVENGSQKGSISKASKRASIASGISVSTANHDGYDSGEESDPEDSETPWHCVVKVRRVHPSSTNTASVAKLKLGTLSPTPHHPKVVAMLKVPFPMSDIHFLPPGQDKAIVLEKRDGFKPNEHEGLMLTAEEMKDILCSTGMWLAIREGFGGVGRVGRKGDGWRIRA